MTPGRIAVRFIRREPVRASVLAGFVFVAVVAAAALTQRIATKLQDDRIHASAVLGETSLWLADETGEPLWLGPETIDSIGEVLIGEAVAFEVAIRLNAFMMDDLGWRPVLLVEDRIPGDGARRVERTVVVANGSPVVFSQVKLAGHAEPELGVFRVEAEELTRQLRAAGIMPDTAGGNSLLVRASDGRPPGVVAFDTREIVGFTFANAAVTSVDEIDKSTGLRTLVGVFNLMLIGVLLIVVVTVVRVSFESRSKSIALLASMGWSRAMLRATLIGEASAATVAGAVTGAAAAIIMTIAVSHSLNLGSILRPAVLSCVTGVIAAFLAVRNTFVDRIGDVMREEMR